MSGPEVRVLEKIPKSSLIDGKPLGQGGFGIVIKGTYNGKDVAIKILHSPVKADVYTEFNFMFQLSHRNLSRMIGIVDLGFSECPQLVFLQAGKGNLLQYVQALDGNALEPMQMGMLNQFAIDVISAMEYLHEKMYIHKTLAARNVLLHQFGDYMHAQVSDYGISRVLDGQGGNYYKTEQGPTLPIRWVAKECIPTKASKGGAWEFASDVWSFGVVLWESWTKGEIPYGASTSNTDVRKTIVEGSSPLTSLRPQCPHEIMGIMESCFRVTPKDRPAFSDLGKAFEALKPQRQAGAQSAVGQGPPPPRQGPKEKSNKGKPNKNPSDQKGPKPGINVAAQRGPRPEGFGPGQRLPQPQGCGPGQKGPRPSFGPGPPNQHRPRNPNFTPAAAGQQREHTPRAPRNPDAPPPYFPSPSMSYAGAPPPQHSLFSIPPSTNTSQTEAAMQIKMMEMQQKIKDLEMKQLEQKLNNLQKKVESGNSGNPKPQKDRQKQQNKTPNQQPHQKQIHNNPVGTPSQMEFASGVVYGAATVVQAVMNKNQQQDTTQNPNKKKGKKKI